MGERIIRSKMKDIMNIMLLDHRRKKYNTWTRKLEYDEELFSSLNAGIKEMLEGLNYDYEVGSALEYNKNEWSKLFTVKLPSLPELKIITIKTIYRSKYTYSKVSHVSIANIYPENPVCPGDVGPIEWYIGYR